MDGVVSQIIVTGRFLDLFLRHKFRGLSKSSPFPYYAMLIKEEAEEVLGADYVNNYPSC